MEKKADMATMGFSYRGAMMAVVTGSGRAYRRAYRRDVAGEQQSSGDSTYLAGRHRGSTHTMATRMDDGLALGKRKSFSPLHHLRGKAGCGWGTGSFGGGALASQSHEGS